MVAWGLGHKGGDPRQRQKDQVHTQQISGHGSGPGGKSYSLFYLPSCGSQRIKPAQPRIQQRQGKMLEESSLPLGLQTASSHLTDCISLAREEER